jgi:hypothetical protein
MPEYQLPPSDDGALRFAEQRWLKEEARLTRQFTIAALWVAAGLIATCVAASFGQLALARVCFIMVFGGMARVIYLCIERQRRFIAVKIAGGLTSENAFRNLTRAFDPGRGQDAEGNESVGSIASF